MNMDMDVRAVLPAIRVPTVVIHRSGDRAVNVGEGRYLAQHIPGARLVELAGEDHIPVADDPEAVIREIERFVADLPRAEPEPDTVLDGPLHRHRGLDGDGRRAR
jgi:pimeloyl-ACP methyl ester carboxylesterase